MKRKTQYRSYFEIIFNILRIARDGKIITAIARESNLAHDPAKNYVKWLQENGLVRIKRESLSKTRSCGVISTTTTGVEFIETFEKLSSLLQNRKPVIIKQIQLVENEISAPKVSQVSWQPGSEIMHQKT
jgi:predicted transcriptional regulator